MKTTIAIIIGILLIGIVSALTGGECENVTFPNTKDVQITITNNQSNMDGFNWTKNGKEITYCISIGFSPQNFTAKWWNSEEVEVSSSGGGGGGYFPSSHYATSQKLQEGYTISLKVKDNIKFKLTNNHKLTLEKIESDSVTILVESEPIEFDLKIGESSLVCIEEGIALNVELIDIIGRKAKIIIKEDICSIETDIPLQNKTDNDIKGDSIIPTPIDKRGLLVYIIFLVIVYIIFLVIVYYYCA